MMSDDDDERGAGDETTPFYIPNSASIPGPSGEEKRNETMKHEKSGLSGRAATQHGHEPDLL